MWGGLLQAAEQAAAAAKELSKKGLEFAEATAGEAQKKLKDLGVVDDRTAPPPQDALMAFGVTPEFVEFVRTLNYSTFRDFPPDQLPPLNEASSTSSTAVEAAHVLNPWQVRHATLVVRAVKEVDELRFVLCPRYLTDELFWHIYFTLVRKHLPEKAYNWGPQDALPATASSEREDHFSFAAIGKQLRQISSKLPAASQGLELAAFNLPGTLAGGSTDSGATIGSSGGTVVPAASSAAVDRLPPKQPEGLLENDPDLEAYLQVAIADAKESGEEGEDDGEELDLDSLMAQLEEDGDGSTAAAEEEASRHGPEEDK